MMSADLSAALLLTGTRQAGAGRKKIDTKDARDFGGHEEEGTGGSLKERRPAVAAQRRARQSQGSRFHR
jgi:hypothetical protein